MRCILCQNFSFNIICGSCQKNFLSPTLSTRTLDHSFKVYSFYRYSEIAELIKTKHSYIGAAVYRMLAKYALGWFVKEFTFSQPLTLIPIDDIPKSGYAHTAILAHAMRTRMLTPAYGALRARNDVSYASKSLAFRQSHPRGFVYHAQGIENVILIDDVITTGTTLLEAKNVVEKAGGNPLFALTLADSR